MRITRYTQPLATSFFNRATPAFARFAPADFEAQIEKLLGNVFGTNGDTSGFFPVDVYEDKTNTYVRAELPGVPRSDITVEAVDGALAITAVRKTSTGDDAQAATLKRTVQIPENTQADKISAASENGVLTITLPKQEQAQPRKFTVQIN